MDIQQQSKNMLRKEEHRIIQEMRKLDLEIAKRDLSENNGEKLSWNIKESQNEELEKLGKLRVELEDIQRKLGDVNLA